MKEYPEEKEISKVEETAEGFLIKISYKKDENEISGGIIFFQKNTFDEWFKKESKLTDKNLYIEFYEYKIPEFIEKNKTFMDSSDAWLNFGHFPKERREHTAVWTGDEMIIWGGNYESYYYNTGGRYSPIVDSWIPTSTTGVPSARAWHTAVWTGESMIVWDGYPTTQSGGIYFPYCSPFQFSNLNPQNGSIDQPLNNLTIDWEDSKYAKSYDLYFGASSPPPLYQSNLSSSIYTLNGLQSNTTYYWYVVAKNSCGERAGEVWSFTTCILPSNFNNLSPANNDINLSAKNLLLDWEDSSSAETYNLYFGYTNPPLLFKTGIMQSQFTIPALAKYGTYYWYVEAVNSCGNKTSEIFSFKTYDPDNIDKGTIYDWGWNYFGQLGDGTNNDSNVPIQVLNLTNIIEIAGGKNHSLALKDDGTVWAWGLNLTGQLGNGTYSNSNIPVQTINLTNIIAIAGGGYHSLALKDDGTVWAWGYNYHGQLGNGTNNHSNVPVQVLNLTGTVGISGGGGHSIALKDNGTVWTWGRNNYGQLGNGTNVSSNIPVQVLNLINPVEIANGMDQSLSIECLIPANFSNLTPENDSINQSTYGLLIDWEDSLNTKSYDLYLGIENPPSLYQSNIQESQYILNGLSYDKTYYWYIVAKNSCSTKTGATWQFTTAPQPKVIPDGSATTIPVMARKNNVIGTELEISWDGQCNPQNANIIYGPLSEISNYTITGSKCDIQNPDIWNIGEKSNIWFVIVSDNGAGIESSWRLNSSGEHRNGTNASSQCGNNLKDNSGTCP